MAGPKGLLAILGKPEKGEEGDDEDMGDESVSELDAAEMAAGDLLDAIRSRDKAGIVDAFRALYDECGMGGHDEE